MSSKKSTPNRSPSKIVSRMFSFKGMFGSKGVGDEEMVSMMVMVVVVPSWHAAVLLRQLSAPPDIGLQVCAFVPHSDASLPCPAFRFQEQFAQYLPTEDFEAQFFKCVTCGE